MILSYKNKKTRNTSRPSFIKESKNKLLILIILLGIICGGLCIFFVSLLLKSRSSVSNQKTEQLIMMPPDGGWKSDQKKSLNDLLKEIDYYQPTYVVEGFEKQFDRNNNDFSIVTYYKNPNSTGYYSSLSMEQMSIEEAKNPGLGLKIYPVEELKDKINSFELKNGREPLIFKKLKLDNFTAYYYETPANPMDPYYDINFRGSEDEKKMRTENDKHIIVYTKKSIIQISIGFGYDISSELAMSELSKMVNSLQKGIIHPDLSLTGDDELKVELETLRHMSHGIAMALKVYRSENGKFPWEIDAKCNNGQSPNMVLADSQDFKSCLKDIEEYIYQKDDEKYYDSDLLSQMYVNGETTSYFGQRNINEDVKVIDSFLKKIPRVCYKAKIISDYTSRYLTWTPKTYVDTYPMYKQNGDVDLDCKDNPIEKGCYYCSNI